MKITRTDVNRKIESLETQINEMRGDDLHNDNPATIIQPHFSFKSKIHCTDEGIGRTILELDSVENGAKYLGYTVFEMEEIFKVGKKFNSISNHPITRILSDEERKKVVQAESALKLLLPNIKNMTIDHSNNITTKIYKHKDGSDVLAHVDDYFNWQTRIATSKILFIDEQN